MSLCVDSELARCVHALAEVSFARAESSADSVGAGFFDMLYHLRTDSIVGCPSVVA